jgi:hypothetical protein
MEFIEMPGKTLFNLLSPEEMDATELRSAGVSEDSVVRVNRQGDIEVRGKVGWEIIGGLLGDYDHRVRTQTGLDWA